MRTSSGPGSGRSRSTASSGPPGLENDHRAHLRHVWTSVERVSSMRATLGELGAPLALNALRRRSARGRSRPAFSRRPRRRRSSPSHAAARSPAPPRSGAETGRRARVRASRPRCDDQGSCCPSAMISITFVPGRQNITFAIAAPNSQTMISASAKVSACSSKLSFSGWIATKPSGFKASIISARLRRLRLLARLRQTSTRFGVSSPGAALRTLARIAAKASRCCGWAFWLLTPLWRLLTIACSIRTGRGRISRIRPSGTSSRAISARCQGFRVQRQHRRAYFRAEMDERDDVEQVVAVVRLLGIRDQQTLAGDNRSAGKPVREEQRLAALRPAPAASTISLTEVRKPGWNGPRKEWRQTGPASRSGARASGTRTGRRGVRASSPARRPCAAT